ncbi:MAG: hypothetical protein DSY76_00595 [Bacteroidetes bacterium]|nr:MAG: hypothetical protein DSY76_00595 [Bacteroidota bacterium]
MGIGKILGMAALGVGAVALAPFTGGGSVAGAATLAASLAGAEAIAAGAAVAGVTAGYAMNRREEEEEEEKQKEIVKANKKAEKMTKIAKAHEEHTNYILALSALGISIANADGKISKEELEELHEFIGGLSAEKYPEHIIEQINNLIDNPPTFNEALEYLNRVEIENFAPIRDILVTIAEADGETHIMEEAYLQAFDMKIKELSK